MSEQPNLAQRHYATEQLTETRNTILRSCGDLLTHRARIEKHREANLARAQEAYLDLEKTRNRILKAFGETRLALLEIEEYGMAQMASKLQMGLTGFELMSTAYKPVYEAITAFAQKLPVGEDTVNAAVIGRLMNSVRMGYYPTDLENIGHILRGIQFPAGITTNLFDPCCGCGKALRHMAEGNNCFAYGMELDEFRGSEAQTRLHRVGMGSFFHSRVSHEAFHLLLLNPPYLSVITEGGSKTRHEKRFLIESIGHLMMDGLLVYIIPYYRLTPDICRILSDNFEDIFVHRFTDEEFKKFKQVVILGTRKKRSDDSVTAQTLETLSYSPEHIPLITQITEDCYTLPAIKKTVEVFKGERFNQKELERQLSHSDSIKRLMFAQSELDSVDKRPLLPLSIGQIGLVGGSGMINGLIDCDTPHIIKGRIIKVKNTQREEQFNSIGAHVGAEIKEVISNKMVFNVLTPQGFLALT